MLVEITAAIRRRTGSRELADRVKNDLLNIDNINFMGLGYEIASHAADIAMKVGVRGMDAIVIQIAKEFDIPLITLDKEMIEKAESLIDIKTIDELW